MAKVYRVDEQFDHSLFTGAACAFGVFDGVHNGHRFIIESAREAAREQGGRCLIVTFDVDPDELFHAQRLKKLMTNDVRIRTLASLDVDGVMVLPFTAQFASLTPAKFLDHTFRHGVPASIHVGNDFHFGAKAAGTLEELEAWGAKFGMRACGYGLLQYDDKPVTSTRIRLLLADGNVEKAAELLGRHYRLQGEVRRGRGEGRDMGFRTATLRIPSQLMPLGDGVYAAYAHIGGERFKAAVSVGIAPTFEDRTDDNIEAHILNFDGDLYGQTIELAFVHWLRPMMAFTNTDELIATVTDNIAWVRENL